jgi:hypothetical protein
MRRPQLRRQRSTRTHCKHGHSLADAYVSDGYRQCRPCQQAAVRRYQERRRAARMTTPAPVPQEAA